MAVTLPTCIVIVFNYEKLLDSGKFRAQILEM